MRASQHNTVHTARKGQGRVPPGYPATLHCAATTLSNETLSACLSVDLCALQHGQLAAGPCGAAAHKGAGTVIGEDKKYMYRMCTACLLALTRGTGHEDHGQFRSGARLHCLVAWQEGVWRWPSGGWWVGCRGEVAAARLRRSALMWPGLACSAQHSTACMVPGHARVTTAGGVLG